MRYYFITIVIIIVTGPNDSLFQKIKHRLRNRK